MALIDCPACEGKVSKECEVCPHCGHQPKNLPVTFGHTEWGKDSVEELKAIREEVKSTSESCNRMWWAMVVIVINIVLMPSFRGCTASKWKKDRITPVEIINP